MTDTSMEKPWLRFYADTTPEEIPPSPHASLGDMVTAAAQEHGDSPAFSNLGHSLSFRDIEELSKSFAAGLIGLGFKPGDRLALQMPNLLQYPVALYGAHKAGLTVVNLNPLYTAVETQRVLADSGARGIVVLTNFADKIEEVRGQTSLQHIILTRPADLLPQPKRSLINFIAGKVKKMEPSFSLPGATWFRSLLKDPAGVGLPGAAAEDVAFLQYTGGTTGGTKAAILTHANILANQAQILGPISTAFSDPHPVVIAALPMYHVFSLTVNAIGMFAFGCHNILITNPRDMPAFVKTVEKARPHGIVFVSTLAGALTENPDFRGLDFSRLEIGLAGGMAVRTSVAEKWKEVTGQDIIEGYGLTEASPVVSVNPPHLPTRLGTIGVPLPSTEVEIRGEDGEVLPTGEAGELAVRGPQVMRGYWNNPKETAEVLTEDGWLLTGDVAVFDEDGYLTIVDRKKEMIVVSGFNVYPSEIEDAAMLHSGVLEAGVIGVPHEHSGEVPKLFVVRRDPSLTEESLRKHLATQLTNYKRPKEIVFRDELPKTNVGKVLRRELEGSE